MEKLLFESKGISKKSKTLFVVSSVVMLICGAFFLLLANLKKSSRSASVFSGSNQIYAGSYGGGYRLSDSGRMTLIVIGIIVIAIGIMLFCNIISTGKSYVKIYENHIQGLSCVGILFFNIKKDYNIEYHQIEDVQVVKNPLYGDTIAIKALGNGYGLMIAENIDQAVALIKQRMHE